MAPCNRAGFGPATSAVILLLAVGLVGCQRYTGAPRTTAVPGFRMGDSVTPADMERVERYVAGLKFDTARGAGDLQPLHLEPCPPCTRHGPEVAIQPEMGTHRLTYGDLAAGAIIAKLINPDTTLGYPRYGLDPGARVYWWVDRVDSRSGRGRSIFFVFGARRRAVESDLVVTPHDSTAWWQGIARWFWGSEETAWGTCGDKGCCQSSGVALRE